MKIGIDCRLWNQTGVGRYIRNLVQELDVLGEKSGHEFYLYLLSDEFETLKFQSPNIHKRRADIRWHSITEQILFPRILGKDKLDLMHFTYYSVPFLYKRQYVITLHDLIIYYFATGEASTLPKIFYHTKHLAYRFLLSQMRKNAKKIMVPLEATREDVLKLFPQVKDKVVVTKEGFDSSLVASNSFSSQVKKLLDQPYFLYVGNAYPHKNVATLIEAHQTMKTDVKLVLVGKDDFFYKRLKLQYNDKNLAILHDVSDSDLAGLYIHAQALVSPSLMEGFGLPVLEAMSLNCLVVASDIPAFREVCGDSALYFNPRSAEDLQSTLEKVLSLDQKTKKDRITKGLARAKTFSWKKMVEQTLAVYESSPSADSGQKYKKSLYKHNESSYSI